MQYENRWRSLLLVGFAFFDSSYFAIMDRFDLKLIPEFDSSPTSPSLVEEYDRDPNVWTASWKWSGDQPPISLRNRLLEYPPPTWLREQYEEELQALIDNGWLRPYLEDELGPPRGLIPLMAILQENKQKV